APQPPQGAFSCLKNVWGRSGRAAAGPQVVHSMRPPRSRGGYTRAGMGSSSLPTLASRLEAAILPLRMRDANAGPSIEPGSGSKVISIVDRLKERQRAKIRDRAAAMHIRELEATIESIEHLEQLAQVDFDAELSKIDAADPEAARISRAQIRSARALQ